MLSEAWYVLLLGDHPVSGMSSHTNTYCPPDDSLLNRYITSIASIDVRMGNPEADEDLIVSSQWCFTPLQFILRFAYATTS